MIVERLYEKQFNECLQTQKDLSTVLKPDLK